VIRTVKLQLTDKV